MQIVDDKLKIVILKCPYNTYRESKETRSILSKIFKLKLDGYLKYYPYGILPISDIDFIADHILMCRYEEGKLTPVSGFKSIKYSVCEQFKISFPLVQHKFGVETEKFKDYVLGVENWILDLKADHIDFAYNLSWTIKPDLDKETRNIIRELTFALMYFHYEQEGIKNIINSTAALRGINSKEESMEMLYLKGPDGKPLGAFDSPTFFGQPFYLMHTKKTGFGDQFKQDCLKFKSMWDSRIIIGDINFDLKKVA